MHDVALHLRRSEESVRKKLGELNLSGPALKPLNREQLRFIDEAIKQRDRATAFRKLAALTIDSYVSGRLSGLATEHDEMAMVLEAKAKL